MSRAWQMRSGIAGLAEMKRRHFGQEQVAVGGEQHPNLMMRSAERTEGYAIAPHQRHWSGGHGGQKGNRCWCHEAVDLQPVLLATLGYPIRCAMTQIGFDGQSRRRFAVGTSWGETELPGEPVVRRCG